MHLFVFNIRDNNDLLFSVAIPGGGLPYDKMVVKNGLKFYMLSHVYYDNVAEAWYARSDAFPDQSFFRLY